MSQILDSSLFPNLSLSVFRLWMCFFFQSTSVSIRFEALSREGLGAWLPNSNPPGFEADALRQAFCAGLHFLIPGSSSEKWVQE